MASVDAPPGSPPILKPGDVVEEKWRVVSHSFARPGGPCQLYEAVDLTDESTKVAIKCDVTGSHASAYLNRDSEVLLDLQKCDCVPKHISLCRFGEKDVLVMELLGEDVRTLIQRQPTIPAGTPLPKKVCVKLGIDMLKCLQEMHEAGWAHRDVKPSNFVFRGQTLCIVDFGLAHRVRKADGSVRGEKDSSDFRGTTLYASPFVHDKKDQCPRDDLFSLLYIVLEMLNGTLPWASSGRQRLDKAEVGRQKKKYLDEPFCTDIGTNIAFRTMFSHLKELKFSDTPDYDCIMTAFQVIAPNDGLPDESTAGFVWEAPPKIIPEPHVSHRSLPEQVAYVSAEDVTENERCKRWIVAAKNVLAIEQNKRQKKKETPTDAEILEQMESVFEAAAKYDEFYATEGLSTKECMRTQRYVYQLEDAIYTVKNKPRAPPPVMSFT